jgi:hypothetical protein
MSPPQKASRVIEVNRPPGRRSGAKLDATAAHKPVTGQSKKYSTKLCSGLLVKWRVTPDPFADFAVATA